MKQHSHTICTLEVSLPYSSNTFERNLADPTSWASFKSLLIAMFKMFKTWHIKEMCN